MFFLWNTIWNTVFSGNTSADVLRLNGSDDGPCLDFLGFEPVTRSVAGAGTDRARLLNSCWGIMPRGHDFNWIIISKRLTWDVQWRAVASSSFGCA